MADEKQCGRCKHASHEGRQCEVPVPAWVREDDEEFVRAVPCNCGAAPQTAWIGNP